MRSVVEDIMMSQVVQRDCIDDRRFAGFLQTLVRKILGWSNDFRSTVALLGWLYFIGGDFCQNLSEWR